jgi:hypothetical protein
MKKLHFRALLLVSIFTMVFGALVGGTRAVIPENVKTAANEQLLPQRMLGVAESAIVVFGGLIAYAGLFALWRPARWILLVAVVFEIISLPIISPWAVYSGWELLGIHADLCLQGVILAIAFSSLFPARDHKVPQKV